MQQEAKLPGHTEFSSSLPALLGAVDPGVTREVAGPGWAGAASDFGMGKGRTTQTGTHLDLVFRPPAQWKAVTFQDKTQRLSVQTCGASIPVLSHPSCVTLSKSLSL